MSLADTITEALRMRQEMRSGGASGVELERAFERVVRDVWPFQREWHYLCEICGDTGLEIVPCAGKNGLCGRTRDHYAHEFGRPCLCRAGGKFVPKTRTPDDVVAAAAKTSRPPSRFGDRR